jgi:ribosomal protein L18E
MPDIKKSFKLIKKLNLVDKADKKKAVIWKDVLEELSTASAAEPKLKE